MTIAANLGAENNWGSQPVTPVWGNQGGPYSVAGAGANALPVQGPTPSGSLAVANPELVGGLDGNGNVQAESVNQDLLVLASAARTATTNGPTMTNQNGDAILIYLNITVASGTGGLKITLQGQDPVSGNWNTIYSVGTGVTATGIYAYSIGPGVSQGANAAYQSQVPRTFRVGVIATDSSSYTYSVGCSLII